MPKGKRQAIVPGVTPRDRSAIPPCPAQDADEYDFVAHRTLKFFKRAELATATVSPLGVVVGENRFTHKLPQRDFLVIRTPKRLIKGDAHATPRRHFRGDDLLA